MWLIIDAWLYLGRGLSSKCSRIGKANHQVLLYIPHHLEFTSTKYCLGNYPLHIQSSLTGWWRFTDSSTLQVRCNGPRLSTSCKNRPATRLPYLMLSSNHNGLCHSPHPLKFYESPLAAATEKQIEDAEENMKYRYVSAWQGKLPISKALIVESLRQSSCAQ